jgi:hypothetical protein
MSANPALASLQLLAGAWDMELSDASSLPQSGDADCDLDLRPG